MCRGRFSLRWGLQKTLELWFAKWVAKGIHRRRLCIADDIWQSRLSPHHVRSDAEYLHPNAQLRPAFFSLYIRLASVCSPLFAVTDILKYRRIYCGCPILRAVCDSLSLSYTGFLRVLMRLIRKYFFPPKRPRYLRLIITSPRSH